MKRMSTQPATSDDLPPRLRALLEAELAAGNAIESVHHGFPAPPVGACVCLTRAITTRATDAADGLSFCTWPNWDRRTGYTDAQGHFFVLNPPLPPPPVPDMDAIRAAMNQPPVAPKAAGAGGEMLRRFEGSMVIDYEKWHDGIGYDLEAVRGASPTERAAIETTLLRRGMKDWRDVEALAEFDTPRANAELRSTLEHAGAEIAMAVLQYAPRVVSAVQRESALVRALGTATIYGGLTGTIAEAAKFRSPAVVDAVLRGCLHRQGDVACHLAGLALHVHGKAESAFDWDQRPLLLRFNTPDRAAREAVFEELCDRIGVDATRYLPPLR